MHVNPNYVVYKIAKNVSIDFKTNENFDLASASHKLIPISPSHKLIPISPSHKLIGPSI